MRALLAVVLFAGCSSSESAPTPVVDSASDTATDSVVTVDSMPSDTGPSDSRDAACKLTKAYSSKDADCNACAEQTCCEEVNGCFGDKRCDDDYVNCILACAILPADAADPAVERDRCVAECDAMHPEGKKAYDAAIGCVERRCVSECG